jgi:hypothetical protein
MRVTTFCGIQLVEARHPAEDILPLWMYVEEEIVGIDYRTYVLYI